MKQEDKTRPNESGQKTPKNQGAGANQSSANPPLANKKWLYPAIYLAAVAIIISLIWGFQGDDRAVVTENELGMDLAQNEDGLTTAVNGEVNDGQPTDENNVPVAAVQEELVWPVAAETSVQILRPFYEVTDSNEEKQQAMIEYEGSFHPNTGLTLGANNGETFEVLAALSGVVTRVEQLPVIGNLIEISHGDGLVTVYQSLDEMIVKKDDQVMQGQIIAQAGSNEYGKDLGVHLQFELLQDGEPVNPEDFLPEL